MSAVASWDHALEITRQGDVTTLAGLVGTLTEELCAQRPEPCAEEPYGRKVLQKTPQGEVMLAGWAHGARCAPHDHGDAVGFVVILRGLFTETTYTVGASDLPPRSERTLVAGSTLVGTPGMVHSMHAHDDGVTLHLYVPGVHAMRVYDVTARETLEVTDDSGAWVPREPSQILRRFPWRAVTAPAPLP